MSESGTVWVGLDRISVVTRDLQRVAAHAVIDSLAAAAGLSLPFDTSVATSRSHSMAYVAACLTTTGRCGIDIEPIDRPVGLDRIADRLLTPPELAELAVAATENESRIVMLRAWTTREAAWKACGHGLAGLTMSFALHGSPNDAVVEAVVGEMPPLRVRRFVWEGAQVAVAYDPGVTVAFDGAHVD